MKRPIKSGKAPANIAAQLLVQLGLKKAATWEDLMSPTKGGNTSGTNQPPLSAKFFAGRERSFPKTKFRVSEQLDVVCDALVCDPELGTIGLLHVLLKKASRKEIRQRLDEAAFLRHLLLEHLRPGSPHSRCSPFAVEVVLVMQEPCAEVLKDLVDTLRELMRESSYLRAIGINLLQLPTSGEPTSSDLRRAFAWLLRDTRRWFAELASRKRSTYRDLAKLELSCFRLDGTRVWNVENDQTNDGNREDRLHIVHGHNGTGKSTLSEAIELLITGQLARVGSELDLAKVVTNSAARARWPKCRAKLSASFQAGARNRLKGYVQSKGFSAPLDKRHVKQRISPNAFRLQQELVDQLAKALPAERARVLLEAFFPEERPLAEHAKQIDIRARDELAKLSSHVRDTLLASNGEMDLASIKERTRWITNATKREIGWADVLNLLPLKASVLLPLANALNESLAKRLSARDHLAWGTLIERAKDLDGSLHWLAARLPQIAELVPPVDALLRRFERGIGGGQRQRTGGLKTQLNQWLRLVALTDLREHEEQVLATLERARELDPNLQLDSATAPLLARGNSLGPVKGGKFAAGAAGSRRRALDELIQQRDRLRTQLGSKNDTPVIERSLLKEAGGILSEEADRIDQAARLGLFGEVWKGVQPSFGEALSQAVKKGQPVVAKAGTRTIEVGAPGWCTELRQEMNRLNEITRSLSPLTGALADTRNQLAPTLEALATLSKLAVQLEAANQQLTERLGKKFAVDQLLGNALNELLVVFTPARWAYQDIRSRASFSGASQSVELETDNIATRLRLNTAELNAMALALFLLCAPANPNPLRMVVLDDPLQNMDEVTVTTVARGFGRMARLWGDPALRLQQWRIAMFLHAEEDVERVREETPCIIHRLPWIAPGSVLSTKELIEIPRYPSRRTCRLQPLVDLLRLSRERP